ncbi:MAG: histidine kinase [Solirubrobacteraceae bacterium]|nr:histidine kinase [Solirubrobacteraceae bacterium]
MTEPGEAQQPASESAKLADESAKLADESAKLADESVTDRAIRRAEELLRRLHGAAPPPGGPAGAPPASAPDAPEASRRHGLPPLPHLPPPPSSGELIGALRAAPSMLDQKIILLRFLAVVVLGACVLVWGADGGGEFWPIWVLFGFACAFGFDAAIARGLDEPDQPAKAFALHLWLTVFTAAVLIAVWVLAGAGAFWPSWPLFWLGLVLLGHALLTPSEVFGRKEQLAARVDELTRTRSGVLDVQAAELRRIERDLHDGAQARLVALSMQLGRAEQRLGDDADADTIALIKGAQEEARQAIAELRDLSRGIAPPLLVDRGLVAAVEAQAQRSPLEVHVDAAGVDRRLPTVVESAAYFVASEALTNAAKHAGAGAGAAVRITMAIDGPWLRLTVADDGPGGADPEGSGLAGLRGRVEALDGRLAVMGAAGSGTTVVAELPCGS